MTLVIMEDSWLQSANLENATGNEGKFINSNFDNANLRDTSFLKAKFTNCTLKHSLLLGAKLNGAVLIGCDLSGAILINADLREANLSRCNLTGAILTGALMEKAIFDEAILQDTVISEEQLRVASSYHGLVFHERNQPKLQIEGAELIPVQLYLDDFVLAWYEAEAKMRRRSFNELATQALIFYLNATSINTDEAE